MKITLDTNCFNIYDDSVLDPIFKLEGNNIISIFFADATIFEVLEGKLKVEDIDKLKRDKAKKRLEKIKKFNQINSWQTFKNHYNAFPIKFADPTLNEKIADILFPHHKQKNGKFDEEDVRQIIAHKQSGNDIFITKNTKDFIDNGKREQLSKLGITVETPEEFLNRF